MNHGRTQLAEGELREPKKKKVRPGTLLRDPYPIIFWNKLGIPPCKELWPSYTGFFDGDSVIVEDPEDMHDIATMGYFGKRLMCRRGYEQSIGDVPVVRERQWKRRVEWAAECGYILMPPDKESCNGSPQTLGAHNNAEPDGPQEGVVEGEEVADVEMLTMGSSEKGALEGKAHQRGEQGVDEVSKCGGQAGEVRGEGSDSKAGKDSTVGGSEGTRVNKESAKSSPSNAQGSSRKLRGQPAGPVGECENGKPLPSKGEPEDVPRHSEGLHDESKDGRDPKVATLEEEGGTLGGREDCGEETDKGSARSCKNEMEVVAPTDAQSSEGGGEVERSGKDDKSPVALPRIEGDLKEGEEGEGETGEGSSMEVMTRKGDESRGRKEKDSRKLKGGAKVCQGARRSPRSTRSSASKMKPRDSDGVGEGVPAKAEQGLASGRARRSLRKSFAPEVASDSKGNPSGGDGVVSILKLDESGATDALETGAEKENESKGGDRGDKGLIDSVSEAAGDPEGGTKSQVSKHGDESSAALEVKCEACEGAAKVEGRRTLRERTRKRRSSRKRNRSPSLGDVSPGGKAEEGEEKKSEGGMSEDVSEVATKRVKINEVTVEEEQRQPNQEEVIVSAMGSNGTSGMGGDHTGTKGEPESVEEAIEKEGGGSSAISGEKEANKPSVEERSAEEKSEKTSLNKSSSDCEIVDIEDESSIQNPVVSKREIPSAEVSCSTPHKQSTGSPEQDAPCGTAADSDDDIMEVSVEEEEVREIARDGMAIINRRRGSGSRMNEGTSSNNNNHREPDRVKFQNMLREIRKNLPRDVEVMKVNLKDLREEGGASKACLRSVAAAASSNENDDDDVIEINLQKSDMMGLEGCDEEEDGGSVGEGGNRDASEVECKDGQTRCLRRRMRKESSGFRRKERPVEGCGAEPKGMKQEVEGTESITTGNLGSDCEVAPCIVIPDSDSEAEEAHGSPRLESDPSIFLPSLDVLQLIPEEAFFLAYGLGCLMVWDVRNADLEPSRCDDHKGDGSAQNDDDALGKGDCGGNPQSNHSVKKEEHEGFEKETTKVPPSSAVMDDKGSVVKDADLGGHNESKSSKSVNRSDSGPNPGGSVECKNVRDTSVGSPNVDPLKSDLAREKEASYKSSTRKNEPPTCTPQDAPPEKCTDPDNVGKENVVQEEKTSEGEADPLTVTAPVDSHGQQNKNDLEPSPSNTSSTAVGSDETVGESRDQEKGGGKGKGACSVDRSDGIEGSCGAPKENGALGGSSITVIDLADSPPSRQWARKGWSSQDQEDVVAMDTDANDVAFVDSESSVADHRSERTLTSEYQRPMGITELWNAFRSTRASVSSSTLPFETTYAVYHHFRSKRWVVKPGIRFGGDFLLYKDGPPFYHASYLVVIDSHGPDRDSKFDWQMLSGMNRLAENIAKDLILCRVEWPQSMTEEELCSPQCLTGLVIQEVLVRRWVSLKEREADGPMAEGEDEDDQESFIPLKL